MPLLQPSAGQRGSAVQTRAEPVQNLVLWFVEPEHTLYKPTQPLQTHASASAQCRPARFCSADPCRAVKTPRPLHPYSLQGSRHVQLQSEHLVTVEPSTRHNLFSRSFRAWCSPCSSQAPQAPQLAPLLSQYTTVTTATTSSVNHGFDDDQRSHTAEHRAPRLARPGRPSVHQRGRHDGT